MSWMLLSAHLVDIGVVVAKCGRKRVETGFGSFLRSAETSIVLSY